MKSYIKLSLWNYLGQGVSILFSLIRIKVLTNLLTLSDYGATGQINTTVSLVVFFCSLNLGHSMVRLGSSMPEHKRVDTLFTINSFQFVLQFVFLLICLPFYQHITLFLTGNNSILTFSLIFSYIFLINAKGQLLNYIVCQGFYIRRIVIETLLVVTELLLLILFLFIDSNINFFLLALSFNVLIFYFVYSIVYRFRVFSGKFSRETLKEMLAYGLPLMGNSVAIMVIESGNRYFINYFYGLQEAGLYNVASRLPSMIELIYTSLTLILLSKLSVLYDTANYERVNYWMNLFFKFFLSLSLLAGIVFIAGGTSLIRFLSNESYIFQTLPVLLLLLVVRCVIYGSFLIYSRLFELQKSTRWIGGCWVLVMLLNLVLNYFLISRWGLVGAVVADIVSLLAGFGVSLLKPVKYIVWTFPVKKLLILFIIGFPVSFFSGNYLFEVNEYWQKALCVCLLIMVTLGALWWGEILKLSDLKDSHEN